MVDVTGAKAFAAEEEARKARMEAEAMEAEGAEERRAAVDNDEVGNDEDDNDKDDTSENAPKEGQGNLNLDPARHGNVSSWLPVHYIFIVHS